MMMTTQTTQPARTRIALSPELLRRIDAINGCQGRWIVDCRAIEGDYSFALRSLSDAWPVAMGQWHPSAFFSQHDGEERKGGYGVDSPQMAALYCAETGWKARLLWCSDYLNDDRSWPGGYDVPSIYRSNARVFRDEFRKELEKADGDADGLSLDVRYVTDGMLEALQSLESYPLLSEDDHSELEVELQNEAWEQSVREDWRKAIASALEDYAPDSDDPAAWWAEEVAERIGDEALYASMRDCAEDTNTYWEEQCCGSCSEGFWIDVDRMAAALDAARLAELTGLALVPPDQRWRYEPYPWPGAEPSPLLLPPTTDAGGAAHA